MIPRKSVVHQRSKHVQSYPFISPLLFFFLCLSSYSISSSVESREHTPIRFLDHECGTLNDQNYCQAFLNLKDAIILCSFGNFEKPYSFPEASNGVLNAWGDRFFHYEGSVYWQIPDWQTPPDSFLCKRVMRKAAEIDVSRRTSLPPALIENEQIFKLYKDYSALLCIFNVLEQDVSFIHENNKAFLHRRMLDAQNYYKSGPFSPLLLDIEDLQERVQYYDKEYQKDRQFIEERREKAITYCKKSLDYCIAHHNSPLARINKGLFDYLDGNVLDALDQIEIALGQTKNEDLESLKEDALILKERSELEAGLYASAILTLSELINRYPTNKEAYFERATAYFELGDFDLSLEDYLMSQIKPKPGTAEPIEIIAFSLGLSKGMIQGGTQASIEFIPSLLSSLQGIGHGLWAFVKDPVQVSMEFIQAAQDCIQFIREHTPQETLIELVPELKECIEKWDQLEDERKGEITGHVIGKYGIDIFAGIGITKAMRHYRQLKRANNLLTFEAMAISERNKSLIKLEATKRKQARKEILKNGNLKIQPDKQGKHIVEHKNYIFSEKKSILEHPHPQRLVDQYAGKGIRITNQQPGVPGYQEIVNFQEFIGYDIDRNTGKKTATTWGKIHYAKDGVHIVPTRPR